jgi:hypothetical protein
LLFRHRNVTQVQRLSIEVLHQQVEMIYAEAGCNA